MEKKTIKITGMSCKHCAAAVTKAVNSVAGAKNAKVDLEAGTVTFNCDTAKLDFSKIVSAVSEAGFAVA
jgi:copper chaperone CopZ